jgi:hypothetical protein
MNDTNENKTTQKNRHDFFAPKNDSQAAFEPVDQDWLGVYMAGEHGSGEEYKTTESMDESPFNYKGPPPGYVFDR